jgi:hypothetical protein
VLVLVLGGNEVGLLGWYHSLSGAKDLVLEVCWWRMMVFLCENRMYAVASPNRTLTAISHLLRRRIEACRALVWFSSPT